MMDQEEFLHELSALKAIHEAGGHPNIAGGGLKRDRAGGFERIRHQATIVRL